MPCEYKLGILPAGAIYITNKIGAAILWPFDHMARFLKIEFGTFTISCKIHPGLTWLIKTL